MSIAAAAMVAILQQEAKKVGTPPELLIAICKVESSLNPKAVNKRDGGKLDSIGLCQLQLPTAKDMGYKGQALGLYEARVNAHYAAKYLNYQLKRYDHVWEYAVAAYNAGSLRKNKYNQIMNRKYVGRVMRTIQ